jgi:hypothetical protein
MGSKEGLGIVWVWYQSKWSVDYVGLDSSVVARATEEPASEDDEGRDCKVFEIEATGTVVECDATRWNLLKKNSELEVGGETCYVTAVLGNVIEVYRDSSTTYELVARASH